MDALAHQQAVYMHANRFQSPKKACKRRRVHTPDQADHTRACASSWPACKKFSFRSARRAVLLAQLGLGQFQGLLKGDRAFSQGCFVPGQVLPGGVEDLGILKRDFRARRQRRHPPHLWRPIVLQTRPSRRHAARPPTPHFSSVAGPTPRRGAKVANHTSSICPHRMGRTAADLPRTLDRRAQALRVIAHRLRENLFLLDASRTFLVHRPAPPPVFTFDKG